MDYTSDRAAGSTSHPPFLDDRTNYALWKAKMKAFLWANNASVWAIVDSGWEYPTRTRKVNTNVSEDGCSSADVKIEKPMSEWIVDENAKSTNN